MHCGGEVFWKDVNRKWTLYQRNEKGLPTEHLCMNKEKKCYNCGSAFIWKQYKEKWLPHETDGTLHVCKPEVDDVPEISDEELKERFGS